MTRTLRSAAQLILVTLMAACSHETGTSPSTPSVVGLWNQGASLRDAANDQTHIHTGYFSFTEQREGFGGQGQQSGFCRAADGDYTGPLATGTWYGITDGAQDGNRVSFRSDLCTYEGTLSGDEAHIAGTARCAYTRGGVSFVWEGEWLANREP